MSTLFRNFIIFLSSLLLVIGTQSAAPEDNALARAAAGVPNKYLSFYNDDGDFPSACDDDDEEEVEEIEEEEGASEDDEPADTDDVREVFEKYHEELNCIFNKKIALVAKGETTEEDLTTYGLSVRASNEYFELRRAILTIRAAEREKIVQLEDYSLVDFETTVKMIDEELDVARKALDMALAAYNELQMALPLHQKYQQVITALEKYRNQAAEIRKEIDVYPATFIDVTTTACT